MTSLSTTPTLSLAQRRCCCGKNSSLAFLYCLQFQKCKARSLYTLFRIVKIETTKTLHPTPQLTGVPRGNQ